MTLEWLILEVDGSLANPYAAATVAVWSAQLSGLAILAVRRWARPRRAKLVWAGIFIGALLLANRAQMIIGTILYAISLQSLVDVGFWGGLPVWIGPAIACCVGVAAWRRGRALRVARPVPVPPSD